jgi:hypothetical protein
VERSAFGVQGGAAGHDGVRERSRTRGAPAGAVGAERRRLYTERSV